MSAEVNARRQLPRTVTDVKVRTAGEHVRGRRSGCCGGPDIISDARPDSEEAIQWDNRKAPHWLSVKSGPGAPGREASQSRVSIMIMLCTYSNS